MKTDIYYDIGCDLCSKHMSTDYNMGMAETKKEAVSWAKKSGWKTVDGKNVCPICLGADKMKWWSPPSY